MHEIIEIKRTLEQRCDIVMKEIEANNIILVVEYDQSATVNRALYLNAINSKHVLNAKLEAYRDSLNITNKILNNI